MQQPHISQNIHESKSMSLYVTQRISLVWAAYGSTQALSLVKLIIGDLFLPSINPSINLLTQRKSLKPSSPPSADPTLQSEIKLMQIHLAASKNIFINKHRWPRSYYLSFCLHFKIRHALGDNDRERGKKQWNCMLKKKRMKNEKNKQNKKRGAELS